VIPQIRIPQEIEGEARRDRRIYLMSAAYFALIVGVFLLELLDVQLVERVVSRLDLPQLFNRLP